MTWGRLGRGGGVSLGQFWGWRGIGGEFWPFGAVFLSWAGFWSISCPDLSRFVWMGADSSGICGDWSGSGSVIPGSSESSGEKREE